MDHHAAPPPVTPGTEQPRPAPTRRGRMTLAWVLLVLSVLLLVTSITMIFQWPCHPDPVLTTFTAGVIGAALVIPVTITQQVRSPAGSGRRWVQATFLYVLSCLVLVATPVLFIGVIFGFDAC